MEKIIKIRKIKKKNQKNQEKKSKKSRKKIKKIRKIKKNQEKKSKKSKIKKISYVFFRVLHPSHRSTLTIPLRHRSLKNEIVQRNITNFVAMEHGLTNNRAEQLESLLSDSQEEHEDMKAKLKMQKLKAKCTQTALDKMTEEKRRPQEKVDRKSAANYELLQRVKIKILPKIMSALNKEKKNLQISFNKLSTEKQILEGNVQKRSESNLEFLEKVEKLEHALLSRESGIRSLDIRSEEKRSANHLRDQYWLIKIPKG